MIKLFLTALAFHVIPNIFMKIIKSTRFGHKVLTALFSAGIEIGRVNKEFNKGFKLFLKYGLGPETLVDYELGLKIGKQISALSFEEQEAYIEAFKETIIENFLTMSEEDKEQVEKTPYVNTIISYAKGDVNKTIESFIIKTSKPVGKEFKYVVMNLLILTVFTIIEPHILFQPIVSFTREKVAKSSFGKRVLKNNFIKGIRGETVNKAKGLIVDLLISPSVLDTMKVGYIFKDNQFIKELSLSL